MKVNIKVEGINKAKIFIDGTEIKTVKKVKFSTAVDEAPTVTLEFIPSEVNIEVDDALILKEMPLEMHNSEELIITAIKKCIPKAVYQKNNK